MRVVQSSKCSLFADDLKVYREVKSLKGCVALQGALSRWCLDNTLDLNVGKCVTISFRGALATIWPDEY